MPVIEGAPAPRGAGRFANRAAVVVLALRLTHIPAGAKGDVFFRAHEGVRGVVMQKAKHHDMCGRPLRSKRNLQERCGLWSGADMCAAFDAAHTPQARMGVRGSGPIQAHALEALVAKLVFLIRSLDRAPSLSFDLPTPRQPRGRDGAYTAATGARYTPPLASSAQTIRAI